jgi:hypothetical protein
MNKGAHWRACTTSKPKDNTFLSGATSLCSDYSTPGKQCLAGTTNPQQVFFDNQDVNVKIMSRMVNGIKEGNVTEVDEQCPCPF